MLPKVTQEVIDSVRHAAEREGRVQYTSRLYDELLSSNPILLSNIQITVEQLTKELGSDISPTFVSINIQYIALMVIKAIQVQTEVNELQSQYDMEYTDGKN